MAEVDTSIYKLPAQPSALDTLGKLQGLKQQEQQIQSGALGIEKQKLDLINQQYGIINKELQGLLGDPNVDFQTVAKRTQNLVNLGLMKPEMMAQFLKDVPTDKTKIPQFLQMKIQSAQNVVDAINYAYGVPGTMDTGQTVQPVRTSPKPGLGIRSEGAPIQKQLPPTAQGVDEAGQPKFLGPQAPQLAPGTVAAPPQVGALPVGTRKLPDGSVMEVGPNTAPPKGLALPIAGGTPTPNQVVQNNFPNIPRGPATGLAPGEAEAQTATKTASGTQLARDLERSANFQREIYPLAQSIPLLEKLGPKGVGPGTETINHWKSLILSNVPGVKADDPAFANVKDFDQLKKYLIDYANTISGSGTNDRLAAAFAGNPNVGISQAASVDVAKAALALRRMQQAQVLEFQNTGKKESEYSKWLAKRTNELDPRAFGVDMMSDDAKQKLRKQLEKNPKEREKFERSLQIAHDLEFLTPAPK